jgi:autotransporter-associated beta strand protein
MNVSIKRSLLGLLGVCVLMVHLCASAGSFATASSPDTTAPVLTTPLAQSITGNSAIINWSSNKVADSRVYFGTAVPLIDVAGGIEFATTHSVKLTKLQPNTRYSYQVISVDPTGNKSTGAVQTFTTGTNALTSQTITAYISSASINTGASATITTTNTGSAGSGSGALSYSSSRPEFATVSASGVVTGVAAGSSMITVTKAADSTYAAATATVDITVTSSPPTTTTVGSGSSIPLSSLGNNANPVLSGGTVTLTSGDSSSVSFSVSSSGGTIQAPTSGSATLSGVFSGNGGLTFAGSGSGRIVLSGTNTYSGGTTVSSGTLVVAGSSPTGTGDVFVSPEGTLMGTGTIAGNLSVSGVLKPGNSPGYLSILQNLTLNTGSSFQEDIAGTTQSSSTTPVGDTGYYAFLNVGGQLTINSGVTLTPRLSNLFSAGELGDGSPIYVPVLGNVFRMITTTGGISGRFTSLTQPAELTSGTQLLAFYNVNNSKSIDLAVVPTSYNTSLAGGTPSVVSAASVLDQWVVLNKAGTATPAQNQVLFGVASQTAANLSAYVQANAAEILATATATAPIPTLSEWAMILLVSLMGMLGLVRMRLGRRHGFAGDLA